MVVLLLVPALAAALLVVHRNRRRSREQWIDELEQVRHDATAPGLAAPATLAPVQNLLDAVPERELAEYGRPDGAVTRVEGGDHILSAWADPDQRWVVEVDLRRGSVWHRGTPTSRVVVHTSAARVDAGDARLLATSEEDGWTYVLCIDGACDVSSVDGDAHLDAGWAARVRPGNKPELAPAPAEALDSDDLVRLHRSLDAQRVRAGLASAS